MKVRCPRKGCNYYATAEAAEDAMEDLQDHLREVHGIDETPDRVKESVEGVIKSQSRSRT
jgi:predicted small metal-binding protein